MAKTKTRVSKSTAPVLAAQDWEPHKDKIVDLYRNRRWPLRLVQEELANKEFYANEGQYRTKLKKWGISKAKDTATDSTAASTGNDGGSPVEELSITQNPEVIVQLSASSLHSVYATANDQNHSASFDQRSPDSDFCVEGRSELPSFADQSSGELFATDETDTVVLDEQPPLSGPVGRCSQPGVTRAFDLADPDEQLVAIPQDILSPQDPQHGNQPGRISTGVSNETLGDSSNFQTNMSHIAWGSLPKEQVVAIPQDIYSHQHPQRRPPVQANIGVYPQPIRDISNFEANMSSMPWEPLADWGDDLIRADLANSGFDEIYYEHFGWVPPVYSYF